jgi:hypothetical protein
VRTKNKMQNCENKLIINLPFLPIKLVLPRKFFIGVSVPAQEIRGHVYM